MASLHTPTLARSTTHTHTQHTTPCAARRTPYLQESVRCCSEVCIRSVAGRHRACRCRCRYRRPARSTVGAANSSKPFSGVFPCRPSATVRQISVHVIDGGGPYLDCGSTVAECTANDQTFGNEAALRRAEKQAKKAQIYHQLDAALTPEDTGFLRGHLVCATYHPRHVAAEGRVAPVCTWWPRRRCGRVQRACTHAHAPDNDTLTPTPRS